MIGFLLAIGVATIAAHLISHGRGVPADVMQDLRAREGHEELLRRHVPDSPVVDERRWREFLTLYRDRVAATDAAEGNVIPVPRGEPQGTVPPLYLFAEMSIDAFARATRFGIGDADLRWRTPRPALAHGGVIVRIHANSAFLHGVEVQRTPQGWAFGPLAPQFVDREWTLNNHEQSLGGRGLVTV